MKRLVVVTDLGTFKAYEFEEDRFATRPKLAVVDALEFTAGTDKISKKLSDSAGRFGKGSVPVSGTNDGSTADNHGIILEDRRRHMQQIGERVGQLLSDGKYDSCFFAASDEINRQIMHYVPDSAKKKIEKNLTCNLVHANHDELLRHFAN